MSVFFVFIAAGFAFGALYAFGLALNFQGWRSKQVQRVGTQPPFTWMFPNVGPDSWGLDLWVRIGAWTGVVIGTFCFVSATIAIINGV